MPGWHSRKGKLSSPLFGRIDGEILMLEGIHSLIKQKMNPREAFVEFGRVGKACSLRYCEGPDPFDGCHKLRTSRLRNHVPAHKHQAPNTQTTSVPHQP